MFGTASIIRQVCRPTAWIVRAYNISPTTRPKRFYKTVDVKPSDDKKPGGWVITLDGRVLKTPARARFVVPSERIALSIALEWDAQRPVVKPFLMPMVWFFSDVSSMSLTTDRVFRLSYVPQ
jgi:chaperone required for assembly of F1-ATPase